MIQFAEIFRDDKFVYVKLISYPETENLKIPIQDFLIWQKDKKEI